MKQLGLEVSFQLRSLLMLNTFEVAMFLHISSFCENTPYKYIPYICFFI